MSAPLPRFVVFGEALTDFIRESDGRWRACPGGACWNVARVAARLGLPSAWGGAVSQDLFGNELREKAIEAGLDDRFIQQVDRPPLLAIVPSTTPPEYFFIGNDSADLYFDPSRLPEGWLAAAEVLHFGCISLARDPLARHLIALAREAAAVGKKIAFDPNLRKLMATPTYFPNFQAVAQIAHYIKVSDEDLAQLFPALNTEEALSELRRIAPQAQILLTQGSQGMTLLTPEGERLTQPAFQVAVADTVGCGDAAMGAWMASLLNAPEASAADHIRYAAAAAAKVASHPGAYAPVPEEVSALLQS